MRAYQPYSWSLFCPVCAKERTFTVAEYLAHCFALRWFTRTHRPEPRFVALALHDRSVVIAHAQYSHADGTTTGLVWVRLCEDHVSRYKPEPMVYGAS